jgi:dihydrofolate synthase / folylpolyglutamate synthase
MRFLKVKTRVMLPPKDNLYGVLDRHLPKLKEGDIVFITSKILAIHQGRSVIVKNTKEKDRLVKKEADKYMPGKALGEFYLTIKGNTLIASAGIDQSNADGYNILWPENVNKLLKEICLYLRKKNKVKKLAVVSTDSHSLPLRSGMLGVSTGFFGLEPLISYVGKRDIFGRKLRYTSINVVDALSATAVFLMGEGDERVPIVIARNVQNLRFTDRQTYRKIVIPEQNDLYYPILKAFRKS